MFRALKTTMVTLAVLPPAPASANPLPNVADAQSGGFLLIEHRQARQVEPGEPKRQTRVQLKYDRPSLPRVAAAARGRMLPAVRAAEVRHRLPSGLLDALIATESAYLPWAVSRAGAVGLAQLMPTTAAEVGVANRFDPLQSIEGGAQYLRTMLDRFGSIGLALAAYNAGPGAVLRAKGIPFNGETPRYVAQVLRRWSAPVD